MLFQQHDTKHLLHFVFSFVCHVGRLSSKVRILLSLFVILLVFVVTTVMVKVDVSERRVGFFVGTMVSVAVVSGASNLFSGSVFGISGHFPMRISQALISGTVLIQVRNDLIQQHRLNTFTVVLKSMQSLQVYTWCWHNIFMCVWVC